MLLIAAERFLLIFRERRVDFLCTIASVESFVLGLLVSSSYDWWCDAWEQHQFQWGYPCQEEGRQGRCVEIVLVQW